MDPLFAPQAQDKLGGDTSVDAARLRGVRHMDATNRDTTNYETNPDV